MDFACQTDLILPQPDDQLDRYIQPYLQELKMRTQLEMQDWKNKLEENMRLLVESKVQAIITKELQQEPARKKCKKQASVSAVAPSVSASEKGRVCSVCRSCNGRDVHRHRDLNIDLDGKCRKQVETFRHGGLIKERLEEWRGALTFATPSDLTRKMLAALGQSAALAQCSDNTPSVHSHSTSSGHSCPLSTSDGSFAEGCTPATSPLSFNHDVLPSNSCRLKAEPMPPPVTNPAILDKMCTAVPCQDTTGQICTVCQDAVLLQQPQVQMPCNHRFHQHCARSWLQQSSSCPTCRTPVIPPTTDNCTTMEVDSTMQEEDIFDLVEDSWFVGMDECLRTGSGNTLAWVS